VWALHVSCISTGIDLQGLETFEGSIYNSLRGGKYIFAQAQIETDIKQIVKKIRGSSTKRFTLAIFLELTWTIWNHEIAHVISGHTRIICEDGVSRFLRETGDIDEITGILAVNDCKIMEGEADCRAASLRTAQLLDRVTEHGRSMDCLAEELARFLLSCITLFTLLFSTRGGRLFNELNYPCPFTRLSYTWGMIRSTLEVNDVEKTIADVALAKALLEFEKFEAAVPELSSIRDIVDQSILSGVKEEIWDIGSQSITRHEHFSGYIFGSSSVEVIETPFD
jgi:hypothetical protein